MEAPSLEENRAERARYDALRPQTAPVEAPSHGGDRAARAGCDATPEQGLLQEEIEERAATQQENRTAQTEVRMAQSADETDEGAPPRSATIVNAGGYSSRTRGSSPKSGHGQEPLHEKQQPLPRPGEVANEAGIDAFQSKQKIRSSLAPEEEPPDAEYIKEGSGSPLETKMCPEPRTAERVNSGGRERGMEEEPT